MLHSRQDAREQWASCAIASREFCLANDLRQPACDPVFDERRVEFCLGSVWLVQLGIAEATATDCEHKAAVAVGYHEASAREAAKCGPDRGP